MPVWPRLPAALTAFATAFVLFQGIASASPETAQGPTPPERLCREAVVAAEGVAGIPQHLMHAISLVESGIFRQEAGGRIAWPWTVMAQGRGRYFTTRQDAINAVRGLLRAGVTNIDVGCMQINLQYHGLAFSSLEEAFDPITNVAYAASFLLDLKSRHGNWDKAVRYYHSATPARNQPYRSKVRAELIALRKTGEPMSAAEHSKRAGQYASASSAAVSPTPRAKSPYGGVMDPRQGNGGTPLYTSPGESPVAAVPNGAEQSANGNERMSYLKTAQWPPRSLKAQYQAEHNARARVMNPVSNSARKTNQVLSNPFLNTSRQLSAVPPNPS